MGQLKVEKPICLVSNEPLEVVLDLGKQPLGNGFMLEKSSPDQFYFQLTCGFSESSKLFQLIEQPSKNLMFHEFYAFETSTSKSMIEHFKSTGIELKKRYQINSSSDLVVEIGSNDGTFLEPFARSGQRHLGVEPAKGLAEIAQQKDIRVLNSFFDSKIATEIKSEHGSARLVFAANVMCHISEIFDVFLGVKLMMSDDGIFVFEDPYLGDVISKNSYDQIYDEHVFLFSAMAIDYLASLVGMELIHCERIVTHGGSMRFHVANRNVYAKDRSVREIIEEETRLGLDRVQTFLKFASSVANSKKIMKGELTRLAESGLVVSAYGATSKSTTIYNYVGIHEGLISQIYDNSPQKIGKFSPGAGIPIVNEKNFVSDRNDVIFLSAWNHSKEIIGRNPWFQIQGGKWLTHVPTVGYVDV